MMFLGLSIFFLMFGFGDFVGLFLFSVLFMYFFSSFYLLGSELIKSDLYGVFGLDYVSFCMVLLLFWVGSLVLVLFYSLFLSFLILALLAGMLGVFCSMNLFYLFIYFEFSMLPMFLIIMFFGSYKERYVAGVYMLIYTMVSSLPMLIVLMILNKWFGGIDLCLGFYNSYYLDDLMKVIIIFMFLVKVPMFVVHIWLPKAHVEAPVFGSMILASVMLKMGGYGVIRCMDFMEFSGSVNSFFFCLCACGSLLVSYSCLFQVDLKVLVAYSSVVHMGLMLMGFFSGNELGYMGGIIMMISHGVCSSGMFYLVNEMYKISGSRLIMFNKGFMSSAPILVIMWFFMLVDNLGAPPCFGILGELMLISGCLSYSFFSMFILVPIIFFISCFVINMYVFMVGGYTFFYRNVELISYYGAFMHLIPLNLAVFFSCKIM